MGKNPSIPFRTEVRTISDADSPPTCCPCCQSKVFTRYSYYFRDLQELGSINVIRRVRFESIVWRCNACKTTFSVHNPLIPERTPYMPDVKQYAEHRILTKGDSAGRVVEDLRILHHVEISDDTVLSWINPKHDSSQEKLNESPIININNPQIPQNSVSFSGVLGIDGTFKSVKAKKKEQRGDENALPLLHLTHLPDGRLVAAWPEEKQKKKSSHSSKK